MDKSIFANRNIGSSSRVSLSEDWIEYRIFFDQDIIGRPYSSSEPIQERLQVQCALIQQYADSISSGYIWQRDAFHLLPVSESASIAASEKASRARRRAVLAAMAVSDPSSADDIREQQISLDMLSDESDDEEKKEDKKEEQSKAAFSKTPPHLRGLVRFGDCIEDEWFIVWLLKEITKKFPDTTATVSDNDGDFLLIEAADEIPSWLQPETSANRVFLRSGTLRILPLPRSPAEMAVLPAAGRALLLRQALQSLLRAPSSLTIASPAIQKLIQTRIQGFPVRFKEERHHVRCCIPSQIAYCLEQDNRLIAAATESFYLRDPISLQACAEMKRFYPISGEKQRVMTMVTFSRCLYAQLSQQVFAPPKAFGSNPLPAQAHPDRRAYDLGIKLTCGFEMLYQKQAKRRRQRSEANGEGGDEGEEKRDKDVLKSLKEDEQWISFKQRLIEKDYFRAEMEGSKLYRQLEQQAAEYFVNTKSTQFESSEDSMGMTPGTSLAEGTLFIDRVDAIVEGIEDQKLLEQSHFTPLLRPDDDDKWMFMSESELDATLSKRFGVGISAEDADEMLAEELKLEQEQMAESDSEDGDEEEKERRKQKQKPSVPGKPFDSKAAASELKKVVDSVRGFVSSSSGFEGVETPHEQKRAPSGTRAGEDDEEEEMSSFDPERFIRVIKRVLGEAADEMDSDQEEEEEEGDNDEDEEEDEMDEEEEEKMREELRQAAGSLRDVMASMDAELGEEQVGDEFTREPKEQPQRQQQQPPTSQPSASAAAPPPSSSELPPINLDANLLQNLLESYSLQEGLPGPAGNLLRQLGLVLPEDSDRLQTRPKQ